VDRSEPTADGAQARDLSNGYSTYALCMLLLIYMINFHDRQIVNSLAESKAKDIELSAWQIDAMSGLAIGL
jgi:hypothetical protein